MKPTILALMMIVMASACLCFGVNKTAETTAGQKVVVSTTTSGGIVDRLADLAAAVASGQSYWCTYNSEGVQVESWINGDKSSSELKTLDGGVVHTISDGTWAYMWVEGETEGMKMKLLDFKPEDSGEIKGMEYAEMAYAAKSAMNVDCRLARLPAGVFKPPSNIKFQDVGELMKQMQQQFNASGAGVQNPCGYCSMITDKEARQECLKNC